MFDSTQEKDVFPSTLRELFEMDDMLLSSYDYEELPEVVKVIENDPAVIVFFSNGEKSVAVAGKDDEFNLEMGAAIAIVKYYTQLTWGDFGRMIREKAE